MTAIVPQAERAADQRSHWYDLPVYLAVRLVICVVQALPASACQTLARWLAALCANVLRVRRDLVDENLRLAFPELTDERRRRLAWQMWEHLFLLVAEVAHTPRKIHETNWRRYVSLAGQRQLVACVVSDRPAVVVAGHYGNFELSGYILGLLGFPSFTVARTLDNRYLDRYVNQFRRAGGQLIVPKDGSGPMIDALLAQGATLAALADQHAGPKGCWVDFFGRPASTHKAIALFALANDAPVLVCYSRRIGGFLRHEMGAAAIADPREQSELASVAALTQWYTHRLEEIIRAGPEQYWWLHRRWRQARPPKRKRHAA